MLIDFHYLVLQTYSQNLAENVNKFSFLCTQKLIYKIRLKNPAQWLLKKASYFSYVNDIGPMSRNDPDL